MSFLGEDEEAQQREATLLQSDTEDADGTNDQQSGGGTSNAYGNGAGRSHPAASTADPSGYYKTLGVSQRASPQDIRKAFLFLSQRYHTDKHTGQGEAMQEAMNTRFQELQEAYTVLSDEKQRAAYDAAGKKGAERLALVPAHYTSRKDIIGYIHSLDREAELIKTARMLSATSDITLNYSTAALFLTPAAKEQVLAAASGGGPELPKAMGGAGGSAGGTTGAAPVSAAAKSAAEEVDDEHPVEPGNEYVKARKPASNSFGGNSGNSNSTTAPEASPSQDKPGKPQDHGVKDGGEAPAPAASSKPSAASGSKSIQAEMVAKEVVIDGRKQVVFIPSEAMQQQIRDRLHAAQAAASGDSVGATAVGTLRSSGPSSGGRSNGSGFFGNRVVMGRTVSFFTALAVSSVPTSMVFRHSFQHALSPRTAVVFRTDARSEGGRAQVSMTTSAEFQQDAINTYAAILRTTIGGLKFTVVKERVLSPLWTLRTKLNCLNGAQLLHKLELALTRKLTETMELTNTIAWSLTERGFFSSRVTQTWEKGAQGVNTYISYHGMSLSAYTASAVTYGAITHDPKHPPARGRVQYSVNCSPFTGQTQAGFEAWYYHAPLHHVGVAFTTVIPYAISPIAPPLFFVESSQYAVVNQVSLLYARGQHRISIPVIVFISPHISQALLWLGLPLLGYRTAQVLYRPYARAKAARYYAQLRQEHVAEMDIAREKASLEQRALEVLILQSRAREDRKGGLVIANAQYGVLSPEFTDDTSAAVASPTTRQAQKKKTRHAPPFFSCLLERAGALMQRTFFPSGRTRRQAATPPPFPSTSSRGEETPANNTFVERSAESVAEDTHAQAAPRGGRGRGKEDEEADDDAMDIPLSIDVTIALQNLVRDSALVLPAGTKKSLVGFCDPDPFTPERKQLKVTYWFRKKKHCAIFEDEDPVELPQREHLVN